MDQTQEDKLKGYLNRIIQTTEELSESKIRSDSTKERLPHRSYFVSTERYINLFLQKKINQRVILIPGLRGIGKTTILFQLYSYLLNTKKIPRERLLYIDAGELVNNLKGKTDELFQIYESTYLKDHLEKTKDPIILFLDEAHYDKDWPSFVKSLFDRSDGEKNVLIFVSGSSALALRTNTDLSRRAISDHLYPLSFQEYLLLKKGFYPPKGTAEKIRISLQSDMESAHHILKNTFNQLQIAFSKSDINLENTLIEYLSLGASPISLTGGPSDLYFRWWNGVLEKIIQQDIPSFSPLGSKMTPTIFGLLHFIAESSPSIHSLQSIASKLNEVSKTTVFNMFEALKNACLIIEISEDLDALKKTNSASKYYFMHPTIRAAILWSLGKFKKDLLLNDSSTLGTLFEDIIAFTLIKNMEKGKVILQVSSDDSDNGADFLVKTIIGKVAIEVGWGKKGASQLRKSIERHSCKFGISITKTNSVSLKDNIITLPRELFLFI